MSGQPQSEATSPRLSWKEGLFLVGPDPLTSPYYSSGALILAGVGFATPLFQIGLYSLLFLLAPLYIEAVLLTLSNGGTYVMTRYALGHLGRLAIPAAALVGIVISFSYVATAIVSMLSYSGYLMSLVVDIPGPRALLGIAVSSIPAAAFGVWVMPREWRQVLATVASSAVVAAALVPILSTHAVVMIPPLIMLFTLNNRGLEESVQVSKTIFLTNLVVMAVTIVVGLAFAVQEGVDWSRFLEGAKVPSSTAGSQGTAGGHGHVPSMLPGFALLGPVLVLKGVASSILGASGVESVMNIPEDLRQPRRDVKRIYRWMLSILLAIGGSVSILLFALLPADELATKADYLIAALGYHTVLGLTGREDLAMIWQSVIVVNAALMLIGATNTGFAGARGLWLTMAKDSLLPRAVLRPNLRGAYERIHWLMLASILLLASQADWELDKLHRWYGASFGLVMFSGMVAFVLLRKYKAEDRRVYRAPFNVPILGVPLPFAALVGLVVLGYSLIGMYESYAGDIGELQSLVTIVGVLVGCVLALYNHRPMLRASWQYLRRVVEAAEPTKIETRDRTIVVAVGGARIGRLLQKSIMLARSQSIASGIPYRQLVVLHMTPSVDEEAVYRVESDSVRPASVTGSSVRIFNEMTQVVPDDMRGYLAIVPPRPGARAEELEAALDSLVEFHDQHGFKGHIVMVGNHAVPSDDIERLQERLQGSTLVPVPLFGD